MLRMVSLLRELLPFLAALYLVDCLTIVRRGHCLFATCFGMEPRVRLGGLALAGLLPLDQAFALSRRGLAATGERLYLPPEDATGAAPYREESWTALPYDEVGDLSVAGKTIRLGGGRRLRLATAAEARDVAAMVRELGVLPAGERESAAAAWSARALEPATVSARLAAFDVVASPVAALGLALACTLFLALPPLVFLGVPPARLTGTLLAAAAVLWAGTAAASAWVARRLRRDGLIVGEGALLAICLSLPSAVRAPLHLGHDLLHGCDFLAAAAVLLPRREVFPLLRAELHGAACAAAGGGSESWRRIWAERRQRLAGLVRHLEVSEEEVLAPPPRRTPAASGYCPFCDSELLPGPALCTKCGTPLLSYPS
jgi:hypothetical protein